MPERYRVNITRRAASDLEEIHAYIEKDSPQNAAGVIAELLEAIDGLELLPHRHPMYHGRRRPSEMVRRMPVPPFLVYDQVKDGARAVTVITVRHGMRRQPRGFKAPKSDS